MKLNQKKLDDLEWVLDNLFFADWQNQEDEPYILVEGLKGESYEYMEKQLTEDLERALETGEVNNMDEFDLVIKYFRNMQQEGFIE
ncbi:MAG: hypothetical protein HOB70_06295 [Chloroflexi bacterium]|jgi:hypothetical protein|nr:hypothetical protein [Chloroflexota bacterium]